MRFLSILALVVGVLEIRQGATGRLENDVQAPREFDVDFDTSVGRFALHVVRSWAPNGADRLFTLLNEGYYDGARFFRVTPRFGVQFGINGDPARARAWSNKKLEPDRVRRSNKSMFVSFAMGMGPDTRTTQLFINLEDNPALDGQGFAPIGWIFSGADAVKTLHSGYYDSTGQGEPEQWRILTEGNAYLAKEFPNLDYVVKASVRR